LRHTILVATIFCTLFSLPAFSQAKPCEELKTEIAAKIDAKGVTNYELSIVGNADVKAEAKVVGSCEGGTKKIVYARK
jgi:hypothetical protein